MSYLRVIFFFAPVLAFPILAHIPLQALRVFPEQVFAGFAHGVHQFFQVGVGFVAQQFVFALFGAVAVGACQQVGHFVGLCGGGVQFFVVTAYAIVLNGLTVLGYKKRS